MKAHYAALVLLLTGGCSDLFGTSSVHTTVEYRPAVPGTALFQADAPSGSSIRVDGTYGAAGCPEVSASTRRDAGELVLRVTLTRGVVDCASALTTLGYRAVISGLDAGTYHLRVEHYGTEDAGIIPGYAGGPEALRYEQEVVVP